MKILSICLFVFAGYGGFAQKCADYYYMQNNKTIEMTLSTRKGKETGKVIYTISDVKKSGSVTTASIRSEMLDKKGKTIATAQNSAKCNNGILMMDMKMMIPAPQMEQMGDISATGSSSYLEYPATMKEGETLKDASFSMDFQMKGGLDGNVSIDLTNRKVIGKEKITTTAGSWDCYKITYHSKMMFKIGIGIPMNSEVTEWYAPGFGVVRTESSGGITEITAVR